MQNEIFIDFDWKLNQICIGCMGKDMKKLIKLNSGAQPFADLF